MYLWIEPLCLLYCVVWRLFFNQLCQWLLLSTPNINLSGDFIRGGLWSLVQIFCIFLLHDCLALLIYYPFPTPPGLHKKIYDSFPCLSVATENSGGFSQDLYRLGFSCCSIHSRLPPYIYVVNGRVLESVLLLHAPSQGALMSAFSFGFFKRSYLSFWTLDLTQKD